MYVANCTIKREHYQVCGCATVQMVPHLGDREKLRDCRSEEHTSELQSRFDLVCRLLLEKKKNRKRLMLKRKLYIVVNCINLYFFSYLCIRVDKNSNVIK